MSELFRLENKTVLITGASSGIGKHCAIFLAQSGAKVAIASRRKDQLQTIVNDIKQMGGQAKAFELDVTNKESVTRCFDELAQWSLPQSLLIMLALASIVSCSNKPSLIGIP
jgi:NADP-dependent 3-hydroxy acid dehydrogenase YdfG